MMSPYGVPGQGQQQGSPAMSMAQLAMMRGQQGAQMPQGMPMPGGPMQPPGAVPMQGMQPGQPLANPSPMGALAITPPQGMGGGMQHPMMPQQPLAGMSPQNATPQQFANLLAAIRGGQPGMAVAPGQTMGQPAPFGMVPPPGAQPGMAQQPQNPSALYALMQQAAGNGSGQ